MGRKIYPNDLCPCGSGSKYKNCCGAKNKTKDFILKKSEQHLEDFVIDRLGEDVCLIQNALQHIIGPWGYEYCQKNADVLKQVCLQDALSEVVKKDFLKLYEKAQAVGIEHHIKNIKPYGGGVPDTQEDITSLMQKGFLEVTQVKIFHAYLMDNLLKRFDDYLYIPAENCVKEQTFGVFARRGYDFFLAITLYIELQLGVHKYMDAMITKELTQKEVLQLKKQLAIDEVEDLEITTSMLYFLKDYVDVIEKLSYKYNMKNEVEIYHSVGAYKEGEYEDRLAMIQPGYYHYLFDNNYIKYLQYLVAATCFNLGTLYERALITFPQCDFAKYMCGIESLTELFEEKIEEREINPEEYHNIEEIKKLSEEYGFGINTEIQTQTRKNIYDVTVFWLMDELNGMSNHVKPADIKYIDQTSIAEDDYTLKDGMRLVNPARKAISIHSVRKLRMELYTLLNGKCFELRYGDTPGRIENQKLIGKYPIIPWVSSGMEPTVHCHPFDKEGKDYEDLYADDIIKRQEYLCMEYRLTEIPVNCIEEYLNPSVFLNWHEKNELLKETQRKNEELKVANANLERHIQLNQELVRNLSHSSANYLNSDKLAQTGISLQKAEEGNPSIDKLHLDGLSLLLQSEQEMYLSRQLNSLVWRCSADVEVLTEQIRSGVSRECGVQVLEPIAFALKAILARVLFREVDTRSEFIRKKMQKTEDEWTLMRSSFMLDILANEKVNGQCVIDWWNQWIGTLCIECSAVWQKLLLIKDRSFYDLITEIVTEQILNALSHGDIQKEIKIELGQAEEFKGRPRWCYILCKNMVGEKFTGGRGVGLITMKETMSLLNYNKRSMETYEEDTLFLSKVWMMASFLRPL